MKEAGFKRQVEELYYWMCNYLTEQTGYYEAHKKNSKNAAYYQGRIAGFDFAKFKLGELLGKEK